MSYFSLIVWYSLGLCICNGYYSFPDMAGRLAVLPYTAKVQHRVVRKAARENAEGIRGTDKVALNGLVTVNPPAETCGMYPLVFLKFWLRLEMRCRTDCSTQRCFNGQLMGLDSKLMQRIN
eukprot:376765_1